MTDETKAKPAPKKRSGGPNPIMSITPDIALMRLKAMEQPTIQGLFKILTDEGHKLSLQTLYHWSKKHGWAAHVARGLDGIKIANSASRAADIANALVDNAKLFTADAITGINWDIAQRLHDALSACRMDTPEDAERLVGVIEKLMAITHAMRGITIQNAASSGNGADGNVLRLGKFGKSANGMNGANGHG